MAKTKQGDVFSCSVCGLVLSVDECGVSAGHLICCEGNPMQKGKAAAAKAKKVSAAAVAQPKAPAKPAPAKAVPKVAEKAVPAKAKTAPKVAEKAAPAKAAPANKPAKAEKPASRKAPAKAKK